MDTTNFRHNSDNSKFLTEEIVGDQNLNFVPKISYTERFQPLIVHF